MRKACVDLNYQLKCASLCRGDLGGGKCMHFIQLSEDLSHITSTKEWGAALDECLGKAEELKYEVTRIRGQALANPKG